MSDLIKTLDEFNNEDYIAEALTISEKLRELRKVKPNEDIKFGIIVATYRSNMADIQNKIQEAIDSIQKQTYRNFKIYLMGDDYDFEHEDELNKLGESIEPDKIVLENINIPGERWRFTGRDLWYSGSNSVANIAIEKAINDGMTHMARLDHDDVWTPRHLEYHAKAYTMFPKSSFVSTTAMMKRMHNTESFGKVYLRPEKKKTKRVGYNNLTHITESWHSAISWDLSIFKELRYRNVREQKLSVPVRAEVKGADRDLIERVKLHCKENKEDKWLHVPTVTMLYRNKRGEIPEFEETLV